MPHSIMYKILYPGFTFKTC